MTKAPISTDNSKQQRDKKRHQDFRLHNDCESTNDNELITKVGLNGTWIKCKIYLQNLYAVNALSDIDVYFKHLTVFSAGENLVPEVRLYRNTEVLHLLFLCLV